MKFFWGLAIGLGIALASPISNSFAALAPEPAEQPGQSDLRIELKVDGIPEVAQEEFPEDPNDGREKGLQAAALRIAEKIAAAVESHPRLNMAVLLSNEAERIPAPARRSGLALIQAVLGGGATFLAIHINSPDLVLQTLPVAAVMGTVFVADRYFWGRSQRVRF